MTGLQTNIVRIIVYDIIPNYLPASAAIFCPLHSDAAVSLARLVAAFPQLVPYRILDSVTEGHKGQISVTLTIKVNQHCSSMLQKNAI